MGKGPASAACAVSEPVKATAAVDGIQDVQNCQIQEHGVGDIIEVLVDMNGFTNRQQCLVIGEDSYLLKLEGGCAVHKADEFQVWRWADEPDVIELDRQASTLSTDSSASTNSVAKKLHRAISFREENESETFDEYETWRSVEDVLMQALLKHWGDGSFQPTQQGDISARRDLENSLRGALAPHLQSCKPQHRLSRQETSLLFAAWSDSLFNGVHEDKPSVSLGEVTMCLRNMTLF
jgi:hypothetical protein